MRHNHLVLMSIAFVLGLAFAGCKKDTPETVTPKITNDKVEVTATTATFTWTVEWVGKRISVVEISEDVDMNNSRFYGSQEEINTSSFSTTANDLKPATKYYYRFWVWNQNYADNRFVMEKKDFSTIGELEVVISNVTVNSTSVTVECNVVSDGGDNVTERGVCWSTSQDPVYTESHLSSGSGTGAFIVNLTGLKSETHYYVRAYAINSVGTAYSDDYTFITSVSPQAPTGAICGLFSISDSKKVWFSKGNLQYIGSATTPYWKFADNQWDYLGSSTNQDNTAPNVDRDLFGWGTSGYHDEGDSYNVNYQPYSTNNATVSTSYNYYGYGPSTNQSNNNIAGTHYDWGVHNAISNGGNHAGLWRTLTKDEWGYVLNTRSSSTLNGNSNARYAKGKVNDVYGVILFPDDYTHPSNVTVPFGINDVGDTGWNYNTYNASDWEVMESKGCVFLPASGGRYEISLGQVGSEGIYWSASCYLNNNSRQASRIWFYESGFDSEHWSERWNGRSVRLVCDAQ